MTLSKRVKLLVGGLTVWPLVYMVLFFLFTATAGFWTGALEGESGEGSPVLFVVVFLAHSFTIFLIFPLFIFYAVSIMRTDRVPKQWKALWAALLLIGSFVAMPIFFFRYVWPDEWPPDAGKGEGVTGEQR